MNKENVGPLSPLLRLARVFPNLSLRTNLSTSTVRLVLFLLIAPTSCENRDRATERASRCARRRVAAGPPASIPRLQIGNLPGAVRKTDALPARIPPSPETLKSDCTKIGHKSDARHQDNFPHSSPILAKQNLISPNQAKIKLLKIKDWTFICEEKVTDYKSDALPTELRQRQNSPS